MKKFRKKVIKRKKSKILREYYNNLLAIYSKLLNESCEKEILNKLKEKIENVENKLRIKHIKVCRNCGSIKIIYRVKKNYIINICKECNYHLFLKLF